MKKTCIIFLLSIIISVTALGFSGVFGQNLPNDGGRYALNTENDYLRIHIRADSNDERAQAVKYAVRDKIVEYLTPLVANFANKEQAVLGIAERINEVERVATHTLREEGFSYGASAEITVESFPTRVYGSFTLPSGEYAALIVRLGAGKGDNWWCVVYPPLCFANPSGEQMIYKSKIKEIIQNFRKK